MRRLTSASFAVALLAFLLPFGTVSCGDVRVEPTGAELVLRTAPEPQGAGNPDIGQIVVDFGGGLATAAFLAFCFALVAAVRGGREAWISLAGFTGVTALIVLKTRGGGGGGAVVEVDAAVGGFLAGIAGGIGAISAFPGWIRNVRPNVPALGLGALLAGYLLPASQTAVLNSSYADSLTIRRPWLALFWLLPIGASIVLVLRRRTASRDLAAAALAVFAPTAAITAHELWRISRDDSVDLGPGPALFLLGLVLSGWFARRARAGPPAAVPARPAPAREAPRGGPSAPGSG